MYATRLPSHNCIAPAFFPLRRDRLGLISTDTSSAQPRTAKKRRASQEPPADLPLAEPVLERSSTFWLDDGNVILQTSTTQFRVHKSVLKIHSTIFMDMFTLAKPDDQPNIDECPVVFVTDAADDWAELLTMLYHTEPMYIDETNVLCTGCLLPMLRLGLKYGFERFKTEALQQLHRMYPRTLKGFDDILNQKLAKSNENIRQLQQVDEGEEFEMLQVMTELGIKTVLPMLYYRCVRNRSPTQIFQGRDGSVAPDDTVYLSNEMQSALAIGKEQICRRYPTTTFSWWHKGEVSSSCASSASCNNRINSVLRRMLKDHEYAIYTALDPLDVKSGLCRECDKEARIAHTAGRQNLLDALPSFFGLPPWDQLKDF